MGFSRSKLSIENQDLINSMKSMELFNYLDERYRDIYNKQILPKPSEIRKSSLSISILFTICILMAILLMVFWELFWNTLFPPLLMMLAIFMHFSDNIPFIKTMKKKNKFYDSEGILKIAAIEYEKGLSFYQSRDMRYLETELYLKYL